MFLRMKEGVFTPSSSERDQHNNQTTQSLYTSTESAVYLNFQLWYNHFKKDEIDIQLTDGGSQHMMLRWDISVLIPNFTICWQGEIWNQLRNFQPPMMAWL